MQNPAEIVTPVFKEPFSIAEAAELGRQIGASWQKTTTQILTTAELCEMAHRRYGSHGLAVVLRAAQMNRSTFMKLVMIGRDERLKRIQSLLPPGFSIIYAVSLLGDEALDEAVKAGIIHPQVRRAEIEDLRKRRNHDHTDDLPAVVEQVAAGGHFEVKLPADIGTNQCARIKQILHGLHTKFGVAILPIKTESVSKPVVNPVSPSGSGSSPVNQSPVLKTQAVAGVKPANLPLRK